MRCSKLPHYAIYRFQLEGRSILTVYTLTVLLLQTNATEHQRILEINNDGSIADTSKLPQCSDGARINLLSYTFQKENCFLSTNCEFQLSQAQQLYIHQKCSLKETCEALVVPMEGGKTSEFLDIKYECLDHFTEFLDLCDNLSKPIYNTVHLLSTQSYQTMSECRCSLNAGQFSLLLNDIRLLSRDGQRCSNSELQVGNNVFNCSGGSVFNKIYGDIPMTSIDLKLRNMLSHNVLPQMTWLIIKPKESLRITCENTPRRYSTHRSTVTVIESTTIVNNTQAHQAADDPSGLYMKIAIICSGAVLVVIIAWVVGFIARGRCNRTRTFIKTQRSNNKDSSNDDKPNVEMPGKFKDNEVEMKLLKQGQDIKDKGNSINKAENEEADNVLKSFLPEHQKTVFKTHRNPRQAAHIDQYKEPLSTANDQQYLMKLQLQ